MTMSRLTLACLLSIALLSGCSNGGVSRIDGAQYLPVDTSGETRVALLRGFGHNEPYKTRNAYKDFENCIRRGLREVKSRANLVRWEKWSASEDYAKFDHILWLPRQFELTDEARVLISGLDVHYLVKVGVASSTTRRRPAFHYQSQAFGAGQSWTETAKMQALIYETASGKLSGELSASLSEAGYWQIMMAWGFIPVPLAYSPNVERGACETLGNALGRYFNGVGNSHIETYRE